MARMILVLWLVAEGLQAQTPPRLRLAEVQDITPAHYHADLTLDPAKSAFSGSIEIAMNIAKAVQIIWLNQERIKIQSAVVKGVKAEIIPGGEDFVGLRLSAPVSGSVIATIRYTGAIEEKNSSGIFRRQVNDDPYLFTQFEQTDARGAFPCFDEPSYKTPWQLTLHIPAGDSAVSNTPIASETSADGMKAVAFKETKPLPSYLVAFGVGPFEYVDAGVAGKNKVPVRIVVPKGKSAQAKYAAEVTAPILTRLEDYFGIPYPYEKSDQVAIPNTVGFGAMENVGMVTYEENIMLADPKLDIIRRQRGYATTAAHELAHQWFGDLVTTAWWDDIWLNEAFATWMERKLISEWKPEWRTRVSDVGDILRAEQDDSLVSARKIRQDIKSKDDINSAFDNITYQKGATVIGMFENWMGADEFRKGVQSYLRQYAFRATTAGEFLDSLSSSSKQNVTKAFSTFLNQAGLPLVSVALDCKGPKPALKVAQTRFLPLGSKGEATKQTWQIPLCVRFGTGTSGQSQCTLITQSAQTIDLTAATGCPAWVEANDKAAGYYRVDYQGGLLASLTSGDVQARLAATERAEFMGNAEALSKAGKLTAADALALVETFHADPDRYVTQSAMSLALAPRAQLVPDSLLPNYRRFLLKNFQARARDLGWLPKPSDSEDIRLLRASLVPPVATVADDPELASQARELADKWFSDHSAVPSEMLGAVLGAAAYYGDKALYDRFLLELTRTKDRQIRSVLLTSMGAFREPSLLEVGMSALINGTIPFLDGSRLLFSGRGQTATAMVSFNFLRKNWDAVVAKMPVQGGFDFGARLPSVGAAFCDAGSRDQLKAFFEPRVDRFISARHELDQVVEGIDLCIAQKAAQGPSVAAFLAKY